MKETLLIGLGFLLVGLVAADMVTTTLTVDGGGILTNWLSNGVWRLMLKLHRGRRKHRWLTMTGWFLLVSIAVLWLVVTWLGWTLVFSASLNAVVNASNDLPANVWERIYFTGYTLSTLGQGDYQPEGTLWQIGTAIASANGFFLVTLAIAYLLPVVGAAIEKRSLSVYLAALGKTADEIILRAWNGKNFGQFDQHLIALAPMLSRMGESHLAYPVLHYFHSGDRLRSLPLSLCALDEALTLMQYGIAPDARPDPAALKAARRASAAFLRTLKGVYLKPSSDVPPFPSLDRIRDRGIPTVSDAELQTAIDNLDRRRSLLVALLYADGWTWEDISTTPTDGWKSVADRYAWDNADGSETPHPHDNIPE